MLLNTEKFSDLSQLQIQWLLPLAKEAGHLMNYELQSNKHDLVTKK